MILQDVAGVQATISALNTIPLVSMPTLNKMAPITPNVDGGIQPRILVQTVDKLRILPVPLVLLSANVDGVAMAFVKREMVPILSYRRAVVDININAVSW
jgi:hypothetical protein